MRGIKTVPNVIVSAGEKMTLTTEGGRFNFNYTPEVWEEDLKINSDQPYLKAGYDNFKILINQIKKEIIR